MHGWTDPLDPDQPQHRPDPGDQPGHRSTDGPRYPGEPTGRHRHEPDGRDSYQQSYRHPADGIESAYPSADEPAFRAGSDFFAAPAQPAPDNEPVERQRLPRPVVVAGIAAAATLAVMIGIGSFLLPSGSDQATSPTSADAAVPAATSGLPGAESGTPPPSPSDSAPATPGPTAAAPAPTTSKAAPPPRQATTRAATKPSGGSLAAASGLSSQEQQVVDLVNKERAAKGCGALKVNSLLMKAARLHTADQASHQNMSHTGSDGSTMQQRIDRVGYKWRTIGENVAYGQRTPTEVMNAWMNSPGHRANILNCQFKEIGVGVVSDSAGRLYWTQDFGASS